jgi:hypothetical protein
MLKFSWIQKVLIGITVSVFLPASTVWALGPQITVLEFKGDGTQINSFELKSNPPKKNLVTTIDGVKALNVDPNNLQESGVKKLLDANFAFKRVCNYREWAVFAKKYPDKEEWQIEELFTKYIEGNNIKLKKNSECFAEELEALIKAHPCLAKRGNIQFLVKPVDQARLDYNLGTGDFRRVVAVALTGCPYESSDEVLPACAFMRTGENKAAFFGPPAWADLVKTCAAEFQKPEIKKLADSAIEVTHSR